jgi:hypothetical protein
VDIQALDKGVENSVAVAQVIVHVVAMQHILQFNHGIVRVIRSLTMGHSTQA